MTGTEIGIGLDSSLHQGFPSTLPPVMRPFAAIPAGFRLEMGDKLEGAV